MRALTGKANPFYSGEFHGEAYYTVTAEDRIRAVKQFTAVQCNAALTLGDLQKTVRTAIERRLRELAKQQSTPAAHPQATQPAGYARGGLIKPTRAVRTCRACGCTDTHACPGGCYWVGADLCSACAPKAAGDRLPIAAAEQISLSHGFRQVIVLAWDGEQTCVATFGMSDEDSAQAAEGGNRIKRALGWPESLCNSVSAKVTALHAHIAELEGQLSQPERMRERSRIEQGASDVLP